MTIEINQTSADTMCGHCGGEFSPTGLVEHLKSDHGYGTKELEDAALQLGLDVEPDMSTLADGPLPDMFNDTLEEMSDKVAAALQRARAESLETDYRAAVSDTRRWTSQAAAGGQGTQTAPEVQEDPTEGRLRPLTGEELVAAFGEFAEDESTGEAALTAWWMQRASEEAKAVIPKSVAYGSNSLMQLGRKIAQLQGRTVDDEEATELGCWINMIQKVERWTDAVMRGERCSDDTVYDAGIYIKMTQRARDVGSWPGV